MLFIALVSILTQCYAFSYTKEALADKIVKLPGSDNLDITFNQFSGYLSIPGNDGDSKQIHYWLVESISSPSDDPLAFWTNGGPGCSGLIGFLTEQGPFKPNADGTLSFNEYAWNQVANMVFIESPAGVGFSYSDDDADYVTGDQQTAIDNYNTIQAFLVRFPQFSNNSLYISSESYGGHYMPTLAKQIVDENTAGENPILNFKGFAVGNPYTNVYSGTPAMFDTFWGHQLVSKPTYDQYISDCYTKVIPDVKGCIQAMTTLSDQVGDLNPYALDYPICTTDSLAKFGRAQRIWLHNHLTAKFTADERKALKVLSTETYEPCEDDYAQTYLNNLEVKKAIHVKETIVWESCSYKVQYNSSDGDVSTAPIYNYLIDGGYGLNILVYSGDDDSVCATIGTQDWIWSLGYDVKGKPWQTYTFADQTAGYLTKWTDTKLAFLTIHGAGHEVPTYKPDVALDFWTKYLNGEYTDA